MPGAPNPEAIAWYLKRSEIVLADLRDRVRSMRVRGAQIGGFAGAVLAIAGANVDSVFDAVHGSARACAGISLLLGCLLLIASLVTALRGTLIPRLSSVLSANEVANYATDRFIREPELWRIHLRTIHAMLGAIESVTSQGDSAARILRKAEYFFLAGLLAVGAAFAIVIAVVTL